MTERQQQEEAAHSSEVIEAQIVVPVFPPRPDAIMTMLHDDNDLPGAQTLLYSVKVREDQGHGSFLSKICNYYPWLLPPFVTQL